MTETNVKMSEGGVHSFFDEDIDIKKYSHRQSTTGNLLYEFYYHVDDHNGLAKKLVYPKGFRIPWHWHHCGHGFYILKGSLVTSAGTYKPGDFVWFDAGTKQWHGAGEDEDLVVIFVTDGACDMNYLNPEFVKDADLTDGVHATLGKDLNLSQHVQKLYDTGKDFYEFEYHKDKFGGVIRKVRYPKGTVTPALRDQCGHGFYVLKGTLRTNVGTYKPGDFVWFDAGTKQWYGAGEDEDVEALEITDGAVNIKEVGK